MVVSARYLTLVIIGMFRKDRKNPLKTFPSSKTGLALGRFAIGQAGFAIQSIALLLIPLGLLTVISKTSPFWLAILSYFFVGEQVLKLEIFGMVICFGALVMISIHDPNAADDDKTGGAESNLTRIIGIVLIFVNSWCTAGTFVINKFLKGIDQMTIIFWHGFFGVVTSLAYLLYDVMRSEDRLFFLKCSYEVYLCLFCAGLCDVIWLVAGLKAA